MKNWMYNISPIYYNSNLVFYKNKKLEGKDCKIRSPKSIGL